MNSHIYHDRHSLVWKTTLVLIMLLLLALLWTPAAAFGQRGQGMQDSTHHASYDVSTVETLVGKLARIDQLPGRMQGMVGMHAILETETETIEIHLGPYVYISKQTFKLREGEGIEVTGSRITHKGEPAILAKEIRRGNEVLSLRDEKGRPNWRGMMHKANGNREN